MFTSLCPTATRACRHSQKSACLLIFLYLLSDSNFLFEISQALTLGPTHYNTLQHTATHCKTLQHTVTHCNELTWKGVQTYWKEFSRIEEIQSICYIQLNFIYKVRSCDEPYECEGEGLNAKALRYLAVCCSVLQCVAVCCSVLQCAAVCCSVLQCVVVCCSVVQCKKHCNTRYFASCALWLWGGYD